MKFFLDFVLILFFSNHYYCLSIEEFYPFGKLAGDKVLFKNDDEFDGPISISTIFPFFNKSYDSLFINTNGLISFENGVSQYSPIQFPLQSVIGVSPYWTDINTLTGGDVFYREVLDPNLLSRFATEIRRAFPSLYNFRPTWAYMSTWYQVAAFEWNEIKRPQFNNTFQAVVVTNGQYSFTIYNYEKLMWPNSLINNTVQAGFNAGDGVTYYTINGSFTDKIPMILSNSSNVGIDGKWIFRVDKNNITSGGCSTTGFLTVTPNNVFAIGGSYITVSGPCFNLDDTVKIRYDNGFELDCQVISLSASKCEIPFIDRIGRIPLNLTVNGSNFKNFFYGNIFTKNEPIKLEITGVDPFYSLDQLDETLNITWDPKYQQNTRRNARYVLFSSTVNTINGEKIIKIIKNNLQDVSNLIIKLRDLISGTIEHINKAEVINFIGIATLDLVDSSTNGLLNSLEYISKFKILNLTRLNADSQCRQWHSKQPDPKKYMDHFCKNNIACRPNIGVSFPASFDTFIQDKSCNPKNAKYCDLFHPGSKSCYRSNSPGLDGSRQQCCYNSAGRLNVGPPGGGTLDLKDGIFSHYTADVLPYYQCCIYSQNCRLYFDKRPSDDGSCWVPPSPSGLTGDPHFLTLDNVKYTFNGWGEFILLEILEIRFEIQVRLEPYKNSLGVLTQGTVFRGIVVAGNDIDKVQIELSEQNNVIILLNGLIYDFNPEDTIALNGLYLVTSDSTFNFIFDNGITIRLELSETHDSFFIVTAVPRSFGSKTRGLLGVMDGNEKNDFTLPNGTIASIDPDNDKEVYYEFGKLWANNENTTIFTYTNGLSYYSYNKSYVPLFLSDGINFTNESLKIIAEEKCGNNKQCLFDISTTGEISIGESTIKFDEEISIFKEELAIASKASGLILTNKAKSVGYLVLAFVFKMFVL